MKKNVLFLLVILLIGIISANTFKQGECIDIKITSNSSLMNISSLSFPNSTTALAESQMSKKGMTFNFTFCNTTKIGIYPCDMNDGAGNVIDCDFEITPSGYSQSTAQGINSIGYLLLMIFLTVIIGMLGFSLKDSDKLWVLGILFIFLSILLLVYDFWLGYEFHKNLTGINDGSSLQENIFVMFLALVGIGIFISAVLLIKNWKKIFKWFKQMKEDAKREEQEEEEKIWD